MLSVFSSAMHLWILPFFVLCSIREFTSRPKNHRFSLSNRKIGENVREMHEKFEWKQFSDK